MNEKTDKDKRKALLWLAGIWTVGILPCLGIVFFQSMTRAFRDQGGELIAAFAPLIVPVPLALWGKFVIATRKVARESEDSNAGGKISWLGYLAIFCSLVYLLMLTCPPALLPRVGYTLSEMRGPLAVVGMFHGLIAVVVGSCTE